MSDNKPVVPTFQDDNRRAFLNRAGKVATTAPAAALLLAASSRPAAADATATSGGAQRGDAFPP